MNDLHDIFIGILGNGFWAVIAFLVIQLLVRLRLHSRGSIQNEPPSSNSDYLFSGFAWNVRRLCGYAALGNLLVYVLATWFRRFALWEHCFGWFLVVLGTIVIAVAYIADPAPAAPKRSAKFNAGMQSFHNGVSFIGVLVAIGFVVYSTYIDSESIALRHHMVVAERDLAESKVKLAEGDARLTATKETLRKAEEHLKQLEDEAARESAATQPVHRSASTK
jgi:hypothetical protein